MKAAALTGPQKIEIIDVPDPQLLNETDVLLKLIAVGVCGSDIHYYTTGRIGDQIVRYPFTLGHECAAIVERTGKNVSKVKPGDVVAVDPAIYCGQCDQCRIGRFHTCRTLKFLGSPGQLQGCLSEYIVMPQQCCYPLPNGMTPGQGVLAEPLSIGIYALKLLDDPSAKSIAILGCGPIGLSVLLAARDNGFQSIFVTDKIDSRLDVAKSANASWTGNPLKSDIVNEIHREQPLMLDAVFECCGQQEAIDQGIKLLKPGGTLLIVGIPETSKLSFDIHLLRRNEIRIINVRRQNNCTRTAIDLINKKKKEVEFMTTHHFTFAESKTAFDIVKDYRDNVIKAIIKFD